MNALTASWLHNDFLDKEIKPRVVIMMLLIPSSTLSNISSLIPSTLPTEVTSYSPTQIPSYSPTQIPSYCPTQSPSSCSPTQIPSYSPTSAPSILPSVIPSTLYPSCSPTMSPIVLVPNSSTSTSTSWNVWMILLVVLFAICVSCFSFIFCRYAVNRYRKLNERDFREWMVDRVDGNDNDYLDDIWDATDDDDFHQPMFHRLPSASSTSNSRHISRNSISPLRSSEDQAWLINWLIDWLIDAFWS